MLFRSLLAGFFEDAKPRDPQSGIDAEDSDDRRKLGCGTRDGNDRSLFQHAPDPAEASGTSIIDRSFQDSMTAVV